MLFPKHTYLSMSELYCDTCTNYGLPREHFMSPFVDFMSPPN